MEAAFISHLQAMLDSRPPTALVELASMVPLYQQYGLPVPQLPEAQLNLAGYQKAFAGQYLLLTESPAPPDPSRLKNTLYLLCRLQDMPRMQQLMRSWLVPDEVMACLYLDFLSRENHPCLAFMEDITSPWSFSDRYNRCLLRAMMKFAQSHQQGLYVSLLSRLQLSLNLELTGQLCAEAALAGPSYLEPVLATLHQQYSVAPRHRLQSMVAIVLKITGEALQESTYATVYRSLLVYLARARLPFWLYLPLCRPSLIQELLELLIEKEGAQEAAWQIEKQMLRNITPLWEAGLLPALLELVDLHGRLHPRKWLLNASIPAVQFVLGRYSQLSFISENFTDPITARLCIDHSRQLYLQHAPLMRRLCLEFNQYNHTTMTTQLELELLGPQARHSLLGWLQDDEIITPRWQDASTDRLTGTLQAIFEQGSGQWLLLQLGFSDPVPDAALQELSAPLDRCIRFVTAYEDVKAIVHLLSQLSDFNLRRSYLKTVATTAVMYDRRSVLAWLQKVSFRCGQGFQIWLSELAAGYGRPPPVWA